MGNEFRHSVLQSTNGGAYKLTAPEAVGSGAQRTQYSLGCTRPAAVVLDVRCCSDATHYDGDPAANQVEPRRNSGSLSSP